MLAAILALVFVTANAIVYTPKPSLTLAQQYEEYCVFWNKTYTTFSEKVTRFHNFKLNVAKIASANALTASKGEGATFGLTKFSDWSAAEFKQLLGFRSSKPLPAISSEKRSVEQAPTGAIDWVAAGKTTPIKDQGQCGSCWAFSVVETVESANLMAGKTIQNGAPQEIVDCDSNDDGCNGGDPQEALDWVIKQGGLEAESDYPYQAEDGDCQQSSFSPVINIKKAIPIASNENTIYNSLKQYGPLSVCADAEPWQNYNGGILTADQCGSDVDHAIQLTGYSPKQGGYWIVRNSWGADWGENGFIYLQYGKDTCAITSEVTAATA